MGEFLNLKIIQKNNLFSQKLVTNLSAPFSFSTIQNLSTKFSNVSDAWFRLLPNLIFGLMCSKKMLEARVMNLKRIVEATLYVEVVSLS